MPDGQVQWIDPTRNVAHIVRKGREFIAPIAEVESAARVPGVRVHFDISRQDGVDGAVNVRLKSGTRTNKRHRRFGDLTGARQPGAKVKSASANQLGIDVTTQPVRVTEAWVRALNSGDVDDVLSLYAPDAVIHHLSGDIRGRARVRATIDDEAATNFDESNVAVTGVDDLVRIDWPEETCFGSENQSTADATSYLRIDHGHIVEQWDRVEPPSVHIDSETEQALVLVVRGHVSDADMAYVHEHYDRFRARIGRPVLFARLKLTVSDEPARERPVTASSTLDIDGRLLRAFVGASTVTEAIDVLIGRLRTQLDRLTEVNHHKTSSGQADADWVGLDDRETRPGYYDRPQAERELVRHKSYTTEEATVDEAAWDMALLDYDFFLFHELGSGQDCLLARSENSLVLHRVDSSVDVHCAEHLDVQLDPSSAATLTVRGAVERLDAGNEPYVFFENASSQHGNVVYRRFDGHYGLITPPAS
ncbi:MAG: sigma 54 modulation/S30EA ribosomal C-terminal domain-containing protein [Acidimicrobiales bacterium]